MSKWLEELHDAEEKHGVMVGKPRSDSVGKQSHTGFDAKSSITQILGIISQEAVDVWCKIQGCEKLSVKDFKEQVSEHIRESQNAEDIDTLLSTLLVAMAEVNPALEKKPEPKQESVSKSSNRDCVELRKDLALGGKGIIVTDSAGKDVGCAGYDSDDEENSIMIRSLASASQEPEISSQQKAAVIQQLIEQGLDEGVRGVTSYRHNDALGSLLKSNGFVSKGKALKFNIDASKISKSDKFFRKSVDSISDI